MIPGYNGRILRIDLTSGKAASQELSDGLLKKFIGGAGLASKILYDEVKPDIDPLSPGNKLIFTLGPFNATPIPAASKINVSFKSPLTGIFGESQVGGHLAPLLKWAGFDGILIEGRSREPVYLYVMEDGAELRSAKGIWGRDVYETEDIIREEVGDPRSRIACIGPAGENLVRFACICIDKWRHAGRCGGGAVMGSKKLKAIVISAERRDVQVSDGEGLKEIVDEVVQRMRRDPLTSKHYPTYGTPAMVDIANRMGFFPTRYWHGGCFEKYEKINADAMIGRLKPKSVACYGCPILCGKYIEIASGKYAGVRIEGPEYETIFAFGGLCEIDDLEAIAKLNDICDRMGMDTISAGNVVAFAISAFEMGALKIEPSIAFGDPDSAERLLEMIAYRRDAGDVLAEGIRSASMRLGVPEIAVHVKGLELPGYDPRALKSVALAYAISSRGACHLRAVAYALDITGVTDRTKLDVERVKLMVDWENRFSIFDSLVLCRFSRTIYDWEILTRAFNAVTGLGYSAEDLKLAAERIVTQKRMFNVREGISRKDDTLPGRFFMEGLKTGPSKGQVVERDDFDEALSEYYRLRGWDSEGRPTDKRLRELELLGEWPAPLTI